MEHTFPAGKYYIGDPCYAIANADWMEVLDQSDFFEKNDGIFFYKGQTCWAHGTAYGDGEYGDNRGNSYGVDAGLIGIMPVTACDKDTLFHVGLDGGNIINFNKDFRVWEGDGTFHFGTLYIKTGDE